jgi:O-antigen/teichoic acid export membrane protein
MRGSAWTAAGYGVRQLLSFASILALARLIDPQAFGLIALATPFLLALQYLQESGMSAALVHRRADVERAAATVLVAAPLIGIVLYGVVYLAAPLAADVFHTPELSLVLRVIGLMVVLRGLGIAPGALLERSMNFRARAHTDIAAAVTQVGVSIPLAVLGAGVWALASGQVAAQAVETVLYWAFTSYRPHPRHASWEMFRELGRYGRFVGANNILNLFNGTIDNLVVGRLLGSTLLAFYALAYRLALLPNSVIGYVVGRVMFSVYATLQHEREIVKRVYLENLQRIAVFALPVALALVLAADPIVRGMLGDRWSPAIGPLRLLGVFGLVKSFAAPANEVFKGLGHPKYGLWFEIVFSLVVLPALILLVPRLGINGAPVALLVALALSGVPAFIVCLRLLSVTPKELAGALAPPFVAAGCVAAVLALAVVLTRDLSPLASLGLVGAAGIVGYIGSTALFARSIVSAMWTNLRATG